MLGLFFYKLGAFLSSFLPKRLSRSIAGMLATIRYRLDSSSRKNVQDNIRIVLGGDGERWEVEGKAKRVFANFADSIYCFLRLPYMSVSELANRCDLNGIDGVAAGLLDKGGFILAGPHVGPWEIAGRRLSDLGVPIHTVTLDHPSVSVTEFFDDRRRSMGIVCHPVSGSFKRLAEALRSGKCVALLIDRNYGRVRRREQLFGLDVPLPSGHSTLAVRCGVPILTASIVFDDACDFKFIYNGPHYPDGTLDERAAMDKLQRQCRDDMETFIREYPDQWFYFESLRKAAS